MNLAIVIPTYNEAENIELLIDSVFKIYPAANIIVVDDNSPDGTAERVLRRQDDYPNLHCLVRKEERGRGFAGVAGFKYALTLNADYIMEMDADFSHDPVYIPAFIEAINSTDVVIGSRFVKGGQDVDRHLFRKLTSILANLYLRVALGVKIRDCTSGYRCFRREVLEKINLERLSSAGPAIIEEILYRCRDFRLKEIPIKFKKRKSGYSKLSLKMLFQSLIIPWRMHR